MEEAKKKLDLEQDRIKYEQRKKVDEGEDKKVKRQKELDGLFAPFSKSDLAGKVAIPPVEREKDQEGNNLNPSEGNPIASKNPNPAKVEEPKPNILNPANVEEPKPNILNPQMLKNPSQIF